MNLSEFQAQQLVAPLLAKERARHAAMRARWSQFGARWPFWAALMVTAFAGMVAL